MSSLATLEPIGLEVRKNVLLLTNRATSKREGFRGQILILTAMYLYGFYQLTGSEMNVIKLSCFKDWFRFRPEDIVISRILCFQSDDK